MSEMKQKIMSEAGRLKEWKSMGSRDRAEETEQRLPLMSTREEGFLPDGYQSESDLGEPTPVSGTSSFEVMHQEWPKDSTLSALSVEALLFPDVPQGDVKPSAAEQLEVLNVPQSEPVEASKRVAMKENEG
jgi:hypothetical protein